MRLTELLTSQAISTRLRARTKREVIAELVQLLESAHGIDSQGEILLRVMHREDGQTTGGFGLFSAECAAVGRTGAAGFFCLKV